MLHAREDYNERIQDSANIIPEDEPVFLIRGQDKFAEATLRFYEDQCRKFGLFDVADKVSDHALAMKLWPKSGYPDLPTEQVEEETVQEDPAEDEENPTRESILDGI